jgi:hypothetical protein
MLSWRAAQGGGAPNIYCFGGAGGYKGGDGVEGKGGGAAAALSRAVAPVGAQSVYCCWASRKGGGATATRLLRWRTRLRP